MQGLNQVGSVLYYYTLSLAPLSVVSPAVNTGKVIVNILGEIALVTMSPSPYFSYCRSLSLSLIYLSIFSLSLYSVTSRKHGQDHR